MDKPKAARTDMKKTESMFAIYLLEDSEGRVTVNVDSVGLGANCATLGYEIIGHLLNAEIMSGGFVTVAVPQESNSIQ
jgi:hypothetical protein